MSIKTIIVGIVTTLFLMGCVAFYKDHYGYEYIDYDNNSGIAKKCYISEKPQGLFCKVDGKIIEVKQYGKR